MWPLRHKPQPKAGAIFSKTQLPHPDKSNYFTHSGGSISNDISGVCKFTVSVSIP